MGVNENGPDEEIDDGSTGLPVDDSGIELEEDDEDEDEDLDDDDDCDDEDDE